MKTWAIKQTVKDKTSHLFNKPFILAEYEDYGKANSELHSLKAFNSFDKFEIVKL